MTRHFYPAIQENTNFSLHKCGIKMTSVVRVFNGIKHIPVASIRSVKSTNVSLLQTVQYLGVRDVRRTTLFHQISAIFLRCNISDLFAFFLNFGQFSLFWQIFAIHLFFDTENETFVLFQSFKLIILYVFEVRIASFLRLAFPKPSPSHRDIHHQKKLYGYLLILSKGVWNKS